MDTVPSCLMTPRIWGSVHGYSLRPGY
eukprot:COSAG02_NODE_59341_length_274_cov_1.148571_1_plen_26_part_01